MQIFPSDTWLLLIVVVLYFVILLTSAFCRSILSLPVIALPRHTLAPIPPAPFCLFNLQLVLYLYLRRLIFDQDAFLLSRI